MMIIHSRIHKFVEQISKTLSLLDQNDVEKLPTSYKT